MAQEFVNTDEVVVGEQIEHVKLITLNRPRQQIEHVKLITLNRPRQLNVISSKVVSLLAEYLEKWEKDDNAELVIIKGSGRAFSAGGDLKMLYDSRKSKDSCLEVVSRIFWLCYHIHTYKKTRVAPVHGISMGGGASLMVPMKFSVVTEKTEFLPLRKLALAFILIVVSHICFSIFLGIWNAGEFLALTGARMNGKELVAAGLATHFVPLEKISDLEKRLISLNSGNENAVKAAIEEFSVEVKAPDEESVLNK